MALAFYCALKRYWGTGVLAGGRRPNGGKLLRGAGQAPIDGGVTVGAGPVSGPITGGFNDVPLCGVELQLRASKSPNGRNTRFLPAPGSLAAIKHVQRLFLSFAFQERTSPDLAESYSESEKKKMKKKPKPVRTPAPLQPRIRFLVTAVIKVTSPPGPLQRWQPSKDHGVWRRVSAGQGKSCSVRVNFFFSRGSEQVQDT